MNVALYLARRLALKSTGSRRLSPGVAVGYVGVTLAVAIMLLSIAVVGGFKKEIVGKLTGFNAPVTIYAPEELETPSFTSGIRLDDSLRSVISGVVPGATVNPVMRQPAIFKTDNDFQGIVLKGVANNPTQWKFYSDNLCEGVIPDLNVTMSEDDGESDRNYNQIIVSSLTAGKLGISIGDKLTTHFLDGQNLRTRRLTVTGIFDTHFHDFDRTFAIVPIEMLQKLARTDSLTGTSVELSDFNIDEAESVASRLSAELMRMDLSDPLHTRTLRVEPIQNTCAQYINWLELLDTNVVVILILMVCVSAFTLISSLFIIILERVSTIGLLKSLGATNGQIRRMFIYMTLKLVVTGVVVGDLIALSTVVLQGHYHLLSLNPDSYYLNFVPVALTIPHILLVDLGVFVMAGLILILPSQIISKLSPASSLRYE